MKASVKIKACRSEIHFADAIKLFFWMELLQPISAYKYERFFSMFKTQ